jgi:DNA-binding NtrC family response regulator
MPSDASKISLLLVDDDPSFLTLFVQSAKAGGKGGDFEITTAASGEEALEKAGLAAPDVVVSDVQMPGMDGLALFSRIADRFPGLPVILLTAYSSVDRAVEAIKMGAYHYFSKPVTDLDLFWNTVEAARAFKRQNDELAALRWERRRLGDGEEMVGRSPAWRRVVDSLTRVAPLPSTVLITGETGTGKEVVARNIHRLSPRTDRPFIAVSCLEFAGTLLETELFGHEKGAFTGAVARKRGHFRTGPRGHALSG